MPRKCPYCEATVKGLASHIRRQHPDKIPNLTPDPEPEPNTQDLNLAVPPEAKADENIYHCIDCGKPVTKGSATCPNCHTTLNWSEVE